MATGDVKNLILRDFELCYVIAGHFNSVQRAFRCVFSLRPSATFEAEIEEAADKRLNTGTSTRKDAISTKLLPND